MLVHIVILVVLFFATLTNALGEIGTIFQNIPKDGVTFIMMHHTQFKLTIYKDGHYTRYVSKQLISQGKWNYNRFMDILTISEATERSSKSSSTTAITSISHYPSTTGITLLMETNLRKSLELRPNGEVMDTLGTKESMNYRWVYHQSHDVLSIGNKHVITTMKYLSDTIMNHVSDSGVTLVMTENDLMSITLYNTGRFWGQFGDRQPTAGEWKYDSMNYTLTLLTNNKRMTLQIYPSSHSPPSYLAQVIFPQSSLGKFGTYPIPKSSWKSKWMVRG